MRIVAFSFAVFLPLVAGAQNFEAAAKHFAAAQEAFGKQHFRTAAAEFELAHEITKDPVLLYNIGEAWQKAGEGKKAVTYYKNYLKAQPTAADKADVQKRIKMIEQKKFKIPDQSAPGDQPGSTPPAQVAPPVESPPVMTPPPPAQPPAAPVAEANGEKPTMLDPFSQPPAPAASPAPAAAEPPPPTPPVEPKDQKKEEKGGLLEDQPVSKLRVAAWIGVAATVAVLTAGAIFGLAAQARADEISRRFTFVDTAGQPRPFDEAQQRDFKNLKDEGELYNGLAIGFFAGAGALAITTTVLFIVDWKKAASRGTSSPSAQRRSPPKPQAWRVTPVVGDKMTGLAAGWSF